MNFKKSILDNGLRVVTESTKGRASVHVGLHLLWGSRNEPENMSGAAHLIEHMVFKGTEKRSAYDLVCEIESVGGDIGASTGKEITAYTVQCLKKDVELSIDLISDLAFQATFLEEEFVKEKNVVLSEIEMSDENFEESIFDFAFLEIFKGSSLARPILGTKETVGALTRDQVYNLYKEVYLPENMVLAASGDVDHEEILKIAKKYFSNIGSKLAEIPHKELEAKFTPGVKSRIQKSEQTHLLVNFKAPPFSDSNSSRYCAYILSLALGGGMTSILYQKIREDKGLAYSVYSYLQCFLYEGVMSVYVATKADKGLEVISLILDEITKLIQEGMTQKQLKLYKQQLLGEILMGQDDLDFRMNSIAINEIIFKEYRPPERVAQEIESITLENMNSYIKKYMDTEPYILTMGPSAHPRK